MCIIDVDIFDNLLRHKLSNIKTKNTEGRRRHRTLWISFYFPVTAVKRNRFNAAVV